jgi:hypothetical protein
VIVDRSRAQAIAGPSLRDAVRRDATIAGRRRAATIAVRRDVTIAVRRDVTIAAGRRRVATIADLSSASIAARKARRTAKGSVGAIHATVPPPRSRSFVDGAVRRKNDVEGAGLEPCAPCERDLPVTVLREHVERRVEAHAVEDRARHEA